MLLDRKRVLDGLGNLSWAAEHVASLAVIFLTELSKFETVVKRNVNKDLNEMKTGIKQELQDALKNIKEKWNAENVTDRL